MEKKPRQSRPTLQQKLTFGDSDLTSSRHDEMMLWLDGKVKCFIDERRRQHWDEALSKECKRTNRNSDLPDYPGVRITSQTWEYAICKPAKPGYTGDVIGFVDMVVAYEEAEPYWDWNGYTWRKQWERRTACFEVKSEIHSLGELVRQVRMYQAYRRGDYVVVAPDDRYADVLRSQGIDFLKFEPDPGPLLR